MKATNRAVIIVIAIITMLPCAYARKNVLNSYTPRNKKAMEKIWKDTGVRGETPTYVYSWQFSYYNEEVYLRDLPETKRNLIENNLLERYKEVIIIKNIPNWYFVVDNAGDIGIYNVDGTLFCPPIPGKIHIFKGAYSFMAIGDMTEITTLKKQFDDFSQKGTGSPTGSCAAIANWRKRTFIIPYGEYIDISFARKITTNHYYVAKRDEHNELKWGITNQNGKLIVPCEYRAVGVKGGFFMPGAYSVHIGGKYVGRNDMSMDEFSLTNRNRYERAQERAQAIANILMPIGETLLSVAEVLPDDTKTYSNNTPNGTVQNNSTFYSSSEKNNEGSKSNNTVAFNTDRNTYHKCESLLINMASNSAYDYSDIVRKDTQRQMRQIREKWAGKGYKIAQSTWETWGGK